MLKGKSTKNVQLAVDGGELLLPFGTAMACCFEVAFEVEKVPKKCSKEKSTKKCNVQLAVEENSCYLLTQ